MEEWLSFFKFINSNQVTPDDDFSYKINSEVVEKTTQVLKQYGQLFHEGLVFWAGHQIKNIIRITHVIAPETLSSEDRVTVTSESNFYVVKTLSSQGVIHLGQVHTHPGMWVDHSLGDNEWASFKREGIISLVVPKYCTDGILPFSKLGVHKYHKNKFIRLSKKYIKSHYEIMNREATFIDLRNQNNYRWKQQNGTD